MNLERRRVAYLLGWVLGLCACQTSREPARVSPSVAPTGEPATTKPDVAPAERTPSSMPVTTFASDVAFLSRFGPVQVLESPSGGRIAVSAQYQGRVMTSATDPDGQSLGFVNRKFIEERKTGTAFDN